MPNDKQLKRTLNKVRRLRQHDEAWEGSARIVRTWITPRNEPPYRPYIVLFAAAAEGKILRSKILQDPPTPEQVFTELLHAMRRPMLGGGRARRPSVVYLDNAEHVTALTPRLAELDVRCKYRQRLPALKEALSSLERSMNQGEPIPGLLTIPGVTPPLVGHLFELAAEFYQLAPWRWLNDHHPLEIRYPPEGEPRYAVVMGSGREVFGLAVYDALADLQAMFTDISTKQAAKSYTWFVLFFEEAMAMPFDDLDAIEKYGWPVFAEHAYPVFGRTTRNLELATPEKADVYWAEGALAAILAYVQDHMLLEMELFPVAAELTLPVTTISGPAQVYLRQPAMRPPDR